MDRKLLNIVDGRFALKAKEVGEEGKFKVQGMNFETLCYQAEGLGNVSVMKAAGMFGLMKMTTVIVNPFSVDAPLFSYDCIQVMGKNIVYLEIFDTTLSGQFEPGKLNKIEAAYKDIPDHELGKHWYDGMRVGIPINKEGKKKYKEAIDKMTLEYFEEYINSCSECPECDEVMKKKKASEYSEGLLKNGGPATDPVKKELGEEKAARFFRTILFATE